MEYGFPVAHINSDVVLSSNVQSLHAKCATVDQSSAVQHPILSRRHTGQHRRSILTDSVGRHVGSCVVGFSGNVAAGNAT